MSSSVIDERAAARSAANTAQQTLDRLAEAVRPSTVFGQPIERGAVTIIPCCEIALGMGMGGGAGTSPAADGRTASGGEGVGAGGGARGRPVAAIVISRDTVRVEPVVDATKVALAALTTAGFMTVWLARLGRPMFGRTAFGRTAFGRTAFGRPMFGRTAFGRTMFGRPMFGRMRAITPSTRPFARLAKALGR